MRRPLILLLTVAVAATVGGLANSQTLQGNPSPDDTATPVPTATTAPLVSTPTHTPTPSPAPLPTTTVTSTSVFGDASTACVETILGRTRTRAIQRGTQTLTPLEEAVIRERCVSSGLPEEPRAEFGGATGSCAQRVLGTPRFREILRGGTLTSTELAAIQTQCGVAPSPTPSTLASPGPDDQMATPPPSAESPTAPPPSSESAPAAESTEEAEDLRPSGARFLKGITPDSVIACIERTLGEDDFSWLNDVRNPTATGELTRFDSLMTRAATCNTPPPPPSAEREISIRVEDLKTHVVDGDTVYCLKGALGPQRFAVISGGRSRPTPDEAARAQDCYESLPPGAPKNAHTLTVGPTPPAIGACLGTALGAERAREIIGGEPATLEELQRARMCFGLVDTPLAPPPEIATSDAVTACLLGVIGRERLARLRRADVEPTPSEQERGGACFQTVNRLEAALLPLPPDRVLFLHATPDTVTVERAATIVEPVSAVRKMPRIVLEGRAPPSTVVELYLFSEVPVIVTVTADARGIWRYVVDQPLTPGTHRAYAVVKLPDQEPVRSAAFTFTVARAARVGPRDSGLVVREPVPVETWRFLAQAVAALLAGAVGLVALYAFVSPPARSGATPPPPARPA